MDGEDRAGPHPALLNDDFFDTLTVAASREGQSRGSSRPGTARAGLLTPKRGTTAAATSSSLVTTSALARRPRKPKFGLTANLTARFRDMDGEPMARPSTRLRPSTAATMARVPAKSAEPYGSRPGFDDASELAGLCADANGSASLAMTVPAALTGGFIPRRLPQPAPFEALVRSQLPSRSGRPPAGWSSDTAARLATPIRRGRGNLVQPHAPARPKTAASHGPTPPGWPPSASPRAGAAALRASPAHSGTAAARPSTGRAVAPSTETAGVVRDWNKRRALGQAGTGGKSAEPLTVLKREAKTSGAWQQPHGVAASAVTPASATTIEARAARAAKQAILVEAGAREGSGPGAFAPSSMPAVPQNRLKLLLGDFSSTTPSGAPSGMRSGAAASNRFPLQLASPAAAEGLRRHMQSTQREAELAAAAAGDDVESQTVANRLGVPGRWAEARAIQRMAAERSATHGQGSLQRPQRGRAGLVTWSLSQPTAVSALRKQLAQQLDTAARAESKGSVASTIRALGMALSGRRGRRSSESAGTSSLAATEAAGEAMAASKALSRGPRLGDTGVGAMLRVAGLRGPAVHVLAGGRLEDPMLDLYQRQSRAKGGMGRRGGGSGTELARGDKAERWEEVAAQAAAGDVSGLYAAVAAPADERWGHFIRDAGESAVAFGSELTGTELEAWLQEWNDAGRASAAAAAARLCGPESGAEPLPEGDRSATMTGLVSAPAVAARPHGRSGIGGGSGAGRDDAMPTSGAYVNGGHAAGTPHGGRGRLSSENGLSARQGRDQRGRGGNTEAGMPPPGSGVAGGFNSDSLFVEVKLREAVSANAAAGGRPSQLLASLALSALERVEPLLGAMRPQVVRARHVVMHAIFADLVPVAQFLANRAQKRPSRGTVSRDEEEHDLGELQMMLRSPFRPSVAQRLVISVARWGLAPLLPSGVWAAGCVAPSPLLAPPMAPFAATPYFAVVRALQGDVRALEVRTAAAELDAASLREELEKQRGVFSSTIRRWQRGVLSTLMAAWRDRTEARKFRLARAARFFKRMHANKTAMARSFFSRWRRGASSSRKERGHDALAQQQQRLEGAQQVVDEHRWRIRHRERSMLGREATMQRLDAAKAKLQRRVTRMQQRSSDRSFGGEGRSSAVVWARAAHSVLQGSLSTALGDAGATGEGLSGGARVRSVGVDDTLAAMAAELQNAAGMVEQMPGSDGVADASSRWSQSAAFSAGTDGGAQTLPRPWADVAGSALRSQDAAKPRKWAPRAAVVWRGVDPTCLADEPLRLVEPAVGKRRGAAAGSGMGAARHMTAAAGPSGVDGSGGGGAGAGKSWVPEGAEGEADVLQMASQPNPVQVYETGAALLGPMLEGDARMALDAVNGSSTGWMGAVRAATQAPADRMRRILAGDRAGLDRVDAPPDGDDASTGSVDSEWTWHMPARDKAAAWVGLQAVQTTNVALLAAQARTVARLQRVVKSQDRQQATMAGATPGGPGVCGAQGAAEAGRTAPVVGATESQADRKVASQGKEESRKHWSDESTEGMTGNAGVALPPVMPGQAPSFLMSFAGIDGDIDLTAHARNRPTANDDTEAASKAQSSKTSPWAASSGAEASAASHGVAAGRSSQGASGQGLATRVPAANVAAAAVVCEWEDARTVVSVGQAQLASAAFRVAERARRRKTLAHLIHMRKQSQRGASASALKAAAEAAALLNSAHQSGAFAGVGAAGEGGIVSDAERVAVARKLMQKWLLLDLMAQTEPPATGAGSWDDTRAGEAAAGSHFFGPLAAMSAFRRSWAARRAVRRLPPEQLLRRWMDAQSAWLSPVLFAELHRRVASSVALATDDKAASDAAEGTADCSSDSDAGRSPGDAAAGAGRGLTKGPSSAGLMSLASRLKPRQVLALSRRIDKDVDERIQDDDDPETAETLIKSAERSDEDWRLRHEWRGLWVEEETERVRRRQAFASRVDRGTRVSSDAPSDSDSDSDSATCSSGGNWGGDVVAAAALGKQLAGQSVGFKALAAAMATKSPPLPGTTASSSQWLGSAPMGTGAAPAETADRRPAAVRMMPRRLRALLGGFFPVVVTPPQAQARTLGGGPATAAGTGGMAARSLPPAAPQRPRGPARAGHSGGPSPYELPLARVGRPSAAVRPAAPGWLSVADPAALSRVVAAFMMRSLSPAMLLHGASFASAVRAGGAVAQPDAGRSAGPPNQRRMSSVAMATETAEAASRSASCAVIAALRGAVVDGALAREAGRAVTLVRAVEQRIAAHSKAVATSAHASRVSRGYGVHMQRVTSPGSVSGSDGPVTRGSRASRPTSRPGGYFGPRSSPDSSVADEDAASFSGVATDNDVTGDAMPPATGSGGGLLASSSISALSEVTDVDLSDSEDDFSAPSSRGRSARSESGTSASANRRGQERSRGGSGRRPDDPSNDVGVANTTDTQLQLADGSAQMHGCPWPSPSQAAQMLSFTPAVVAAQWMLARAGGVDVRPIFSSLFRLRADLLTLSGHRGGSGDRSAVVWPSDATEHARSAKSAAALLVSLQGGGDDDGDASGGIPAKHRSATDAAAQFAAATSARERSVRGRRDSLAALATGKAANKDEAEAAKQGLRGIGPVALSPIHLLVQLAVSSLQAQPRLEAVLPVLLGARRLALAAGAPGPTTIRKPTASPGSGGLATAPQQAVLREPGGVAAEVELGLAVRTPRTAAEQDTHLVLAGVRPSVRTAQAVVSGAVSPHGDPAADVAEAAIVTGPMRWIAVYADGGGGLAKVSRGETSNSGMVAVTAASRLSAQQLQLLEDEAGKQHTAAPVDLMTLANLTNRTISGGHVIVESPARALAWSMQRALPAGLIPGADPGAARQGAQTNGIGTLGAGDVMVPVRDVARPWSFADPRSGQSSLHDDAERSLFAATRPEFKNGVDSISWNHQASTITARGGVTADAMAAIVASSALPGTGSGCVPKDGLVGSVSFTDKDMAAIVQASAAGVASAASVLGSNTGALIAGPLVASLMPWLRMWPGLPRRPTATGRKEAVLGASAVAAWPWSLSLTANAAETAAIAALAGGQRTAPGAGVPSPPGLCQSPGSAASAAPGLPRTIPCSVVARQAARPAPETPSSYHELASDVLTTKDRSTVLPPGCGPRTARQLIERATARALDALDASEAAVRQQAASDATYHAGVDGLARTSWVCLAGMAQSAVRKREAEARQAAAGRLVATAGGRASEETVIAWRGDGQRAEAIMGGEEHSGLDGSMRDLWAVAAREEAAPRQRAPAAHPLSGPGSFLRGEAGAGGRPATTASQRPGSSRASRRRQVNGGKRKKGEPWDGGDTAIRCPVEHLPQGVSEGAGTGEADKALRIEIFSSVSPRRVIDVIVACCQDEIKMEASQKLIETRAAGIAVDVALAKAAREQARDIDVSPSRVASAVQDVNEVLAAYASLIRATFRLYAALAVKPRRRAASKARTTAGATASAADVAASDDHEMLMDFGEFQRFLRETGILRPASDTRSALSGTILQNREADADEAKRRQRRAETMGARGYTGGRRSSVTGDLSSGDDEEGMVVQRRHKTGEEHAASGSAAMIGVMRRRADAGKPRITPTAVKQLFSLVNRPVVRAGAALSRSSSEATMAELHGMEGGNKRVAGSAQRSRAREAATSWDTREDVVNSDDEEAEAQAARAGSGGMAGGAAEVAEMLEGKSAAGHDAKSLGHPEGSAGFQVGDTSLRSGAGAASVQELLLASARRFEAGERSRGASPAKRLRGAIRGILAISRARAGLAATLSGTPKRFGSASHALGASASVAGSTDSNADSISRALRAAGGDGSMHGKRVASRNPLVPTPGASVPLSAAGESEFSATGAMGTTIPSRRPLDGVAPPPTSALGAEQSGAVLASTGFSVRFQSGADYLTSSDSDSDVNDNNDGEGEEDEQTELQSRLSGRLGKSARGHGDDDDDDFDISNGAEASNPDDALNAREFVEMLLRLAAKQFSGSRQRRKTPSLAARLRKLIETHVLRGMHAADASELRRVIASRPVVVSLNACRPFTRRLFRGYLLLQVWSQRAALARLRRRVAKGGRSAAPLAGLVVTEGILASTWMRMLADAGVVGRLVKQKNDTPEIIEWARRKAHAGKLAVSPTRTEASAAASGDVDGHPDTDDAGAFKHAVRIMGWHRMGRMGLPKLSATAARRLFRDSQAAHGDVRASAAAHATEDVVVESSDEESKPMGEGSQGTPKQRPSSAGEDDVGQGTSQAEAMTASALAALDNDSVMIEPEFLEALTALALHSVSDPLLATPARLTIFLRALAATPAMGFAVSALRV